MTHLTLGLAPQRLAVEEVSPDGAVLPAVAAARGVPAPLADQAEADRRQRFELADEALTALVPTRAAAAMTNR